ncbi:hypothetical protein BFJ63_vAg16401 [Fusarium oxysporum f. sp. narcissi]|uniref:Uncharacterized protein n=1 Tax=Fusarium oxysporum f. sp. narcissi TaxID=451672 RepID=A0A4Q2V278_FUSOX|nr:hypothetical protein BFJ63_vAg16401 [Fusarium oxysporum f. sp. narcissi]
MHRPYPVTFLVPVRWPLCRILLGPRFTRLPPFNTLEQPSTHFRSSLLQRSHPGVVTAAAIAVASPARPAQAHVYANRRTSSVSKLNQRSSSGILALVVAGPDRTQSAIATILDLAIPPPQRHSNGTLSRLTPPRLDARLRGLQPGQEAAGPGVPRASPCLSSINLASAVATQAALTNNSPSQPYIATDPNQPPPIKSPVTANKMH